MEAEAARTTAVENFIVNDLVCGRKRVNSTAGCIQTKDWKRRDAE